MAIELFVPAPTDSLISFSDTPLGSYLGIEPYIDFTLDNFNISPLLAAIKYSGLLILIESWSFLLPEDICRGSLKSI